MDFEQILAWRHHLHKHPELSRQEFETSNYIYSELSAFPNIRLSRPTQTSVVAEVGQGEPVILYRADIDALACQETIEEEWKSANSGVAHTCGHDTHAAMLMGAAKELSEHTDRLNGTVRMVFQHSEEKKPSGAEELVNAGVCKGVKYAFGMHIVTCQPTGSIYITEGPTTTASSRFELHIKGRGAHTATPELSIDPVYVGAQVVVAVQSIISRNTPPAETATISFGEFKTGTASSVIPETAYLSGSMRSFRREFTDFLEERFRQVVEGVCKTYGAEVEIVITKGLPPTVNDPAACRAVEAAANKTVGSEKVLYGAEASNAGDDFAFYAQAVPSCYFRLGGGEAKDGCGYMNHNPAFRVVESALLSGAETWVQIAYDLLGK